MPVTGILHATTTTITTNNNNNTAPSTTTLPRVPRAPRAPRSSECQFDNRFNSWLNGQLDPKNLVNGKATLSYRGIKNDTTFVPRMKMKKKKDGSEIMVHDTSDDDLILLKRIYLDLKTKHDVKTSVKAQTNNLFANKERGVKHRTNVQFKHVNQLTTSLAIKKANELDLHVPFLCEELGVDKINGEIQSLVPLAHREHQKPIVEEPDDDEDEFNRKFSNLSIE